MSGKCPVSYDPETKIWTSLEQNNVFNPEAGLGAIILFCLEKTPNKVTQINADDGSVMTCAEMRSKIIRVAVNLTKMGLKQGDVVSTASKNVPGLAPVLFGCWLIGVTVNPLDLVYSKSDSIRMIQMTGSQLLICDQENFDIANILNLHLKILNLDDTLFQNVNTVDSFIPPKLEDPSNCIGVILCSSGTTGPCKGVKLSHGLLISNYANFCHMTEDDITLNFASIFWTTALLTLLTGTFYGATRLISTEKTSPEVVECLVNRFRVTQLFLGNYYTTLLADYLGKSGAKLPTVKIFSMGGGCVTEKLENSIREFFPNGLVQPSYGNTEVGSISRWVKRKFRNGGLGILKNGIQAKILDKKGQHLGPGEIGEICIKIRFPFSGYVANDEATRKALDSDGWLYTGDMGYFDEKNYLMFFDRKKDFIDFIDSDGQIYVSLSELEGIVGQIDGVDSVCVIGVLDPSGYTRPAAVIVKTKDSHLTEKDIREYVTARVDSRKNLSGGVYFVNQIPLTSSGKILRRKVSEMFANNLLTSVEKINKI